MCIFSSAVTAGVALAKSAAGAVGLGGASAGGATGAGVASTAGGTVAGSTVGSTVAGAAAKTAATGVAKSAVGGAAAKGAGMSLTNTLLTGASLASAGAGIYSSMQKPPSPNAPKPLAPLQEGTGQGLREEQLKRKRAALAASQTRAGALVAPPTIGRKTLLGV